MEIDRQIARWTNRWIDIDIAEYHGVSTCPPLNVPTGLVRPYSGKPMVYKPLHNKGRLGGV